MMSFIPPQASPQRFLVVIFALCSSVCWSRGSVVEEHAFAEQCATPIWEISDQARKANHASLLQRAVVPPDSKSLDDNDTLDRFREVSFGNPTNTILEGESSRSTMKEAGASLLTPSVATERDSFVVDNVDESRNEGRSVAGQSRDKAKASDKHANLRNNVQPHGEDLVDVSSHRGESEEESDSMFPVSFTTPPSTFGEAGKTYAVMKPRLAMPTASASSETNRASLPEEYMKEHQGESDMGEQHFNAELVNEGVDEEQAEEERTVEMDEPEGEQFDSKHVSQEKNGHLSNSKGPQIDDRQRSQELPATSIELSGNDDVSFEKDGTYSKEGGADSKSAAFSESHRQHLAHVEGENTEVDDDGQLQENVEEAVTKKAARKRGSKQATTKKSTYRLEREEEAAETGVEEEKDETSTGAAHGPDELGKSVAGEQARLKGSGRRADVVDTHHAQRYELKDGADREEESEQSSSEQTSLKTQQENSHEADAKEAEDSEEWHEQDTEDEIDNMDYESVKEGGSRRVQTTRRHATKNSDKGEQIPWHEHDTSEGDEDAVDITSIGYAEPEIDAHRSQDEDRPFVRPAKIEERELDMIGIGKLRHWRSMSTDPNDLALVAPLTDKGYQAVAVLRSHVAMETYIRRVVTNMGCKVADNAGLQGVIPFYSGEIASQSFAALEGEIYQVCTGRGGKSVWLSGLSSPQSSGTRLRASMAAKKPLSLIASKSLYLSRASRTGDGLASLRDATLLGNFNETDEGKHSANMRKQLLSLVAANSSYSPRSTREEHDGYLDRNVDAGQSGPEAVASITNLFQLTAAERDHRRPKVAQAQVDQSVDMAVDADDVAIVAPLSEKGYKYVSRLQSNSAMEIYIRRVVNSMGCRVADEGGVEGVVPYYSGEASVQSFAALQAEIHKTCKGKHSWLSSMSLVPKRSVVRRMSALQVGLGSHVEVAPTVSGSSAPITEEGLKSVVELSDELEIQRYIRRVISSLNGWVVDEFGLHGLVPFYDGAKAERTLGQLITELREVMQRSDGWVMNASAAASWNDIPAVPQFDHSDVLQRVGQIADPKFQECPENIEDRRALKLIASGTPLNEDGYETLAQMKNDCAMMHYIIRVVDDLNCEVHEESGLKGVVPFYSGTHGIQDFVELQNEMTSLCHLKGSWVRSKSASALASPASYVQAPNKSTNVHQF